MTLASETLECIARPARSHRSITRMTLAGAAIVLQSIVYVPAALAQNFGEWSKAVSVDPGRSNNVNTSANDGCPIEAPDGHTLYFASNRFKSPADNDIWVASRDSEDAPWGDPVALEPINSNANDFCPTPLPGNRLLFVSARANHCGGLANNADIYLTRHHPVFGWLPPEPLGCEVNSGFDEFSPSLVESDGATMLFFSSNRGDGVRHKIHVSLLQPDGRWGYPVSVDELNMAGASDARPNVRKDGLEIVFDSTRGGSADIYTATRASIFDTWSIPERLSSNVNDVSQAETRPTLSRDGTRLYFGSTRANGTGDAGSDIFVATRSGPGKGKN